MGTSLIDSASPFTPARVGSQGALRAEQRPSEVGALGSYRKAQTSGTIAAGLSAASRVFSFRWAPSVLTQKAIIKSIRLDLGDLVAFTAGFIKLDAFVARAMSAIDNSGGTAGTFTGNNAKMMTSFPTSAGGNSYISTTAATSGGSETLDTDPFASCSISAAAVAGAPLAPLPIDFFKPLGNDWPLVLAASEGFIIKATVPATGTWQIGVEFAWDEVASYPA